MGIPLSDAVQARLNTEKVAWLTTVRPDGLPQPTPIWFLWDGVGLVIYSKPEARKLRNIAAHPRISFHLNSDAWGGEIVVLWGTATVDLHGPLATANPAYIEKYRQGIADIGMTPESMAAEYSALIRIIPERAREE
jgi:PPOX class probable F420-dependent enzyme